MNRVEFDALYRRGAECCWESFNQMQQRVLELEGRLKQNSNNSHRPPSSDIAKAKRKANNSRVRSGRKPGGQPGHRGHTLKLVANPDHIFVILPPPCTCGHCFDGSETTLNLERRQVVDIPKPAIETTEFRARTLQCANCGQSAKGIFPEHVNAPVQYGANIRTLCISLHIGNFVPYGRTAELINDMFGIRISMGTLRNIVAQTAVNSQPSVANIKQGIISSPVVHFDETGSRCCGKREWDHVASTRTLTYYYHHQHRGQSAMDAGGVLPNFTGNAIHDHWGPYYVYGKCQHHPCNTHLLRDTQGIHDTYQWDWSLAMKRHLQLGKRLVDEAKLQGDRTLSSSQLNRFRAAYRKVIKAGRSEMPPPAPPPKGKRGRPARGKALCLLDRLDVTSAQILSFMTDFDIPFDNNQAERDMRMDKLKQKNSGGFRSAQGAKDFCDLRSVYSTARKQTVNAMETIRNLVKGEMPKIDTSGNMRHPRTSHLPNQPDFGAE